MLYMYFRVRFWEQNDLYRYISITQVIYSDPNNTILHPQYTFCFQNDRLWRFKFGLGYAYNLLKIIIFNVSVNIWIERFFFIYKYICIWHSSIVAFKLACLRLILHILFIERHNSSGWFFSSWKFISFPPLTCILELQFAKLSKEIYVKIHEEKKLFIKYIFEY